MSQQSISDPVRKRFITVVLTAVVFCSMLPATANAQAGSEQAKDGPVTWTITINATGDQTLLKSSDYTLGCQPTPCPGKQTDASDTIHISSGDTVEWQTTSSNPKNTEMWIVHEDAILTSGKSDLFGTHLHHGTGGTAIGGPTAGLALPGSAQHRYYIFVYNRDKNITYVSDPKIMIGGSGREHCQEFASQFPKKSEQHAAERFCNEINKIEGNTASERR